MALIVMAVLLTAVMLLAGLRRRHREKTRGALQAEIARHRLESDRERQDWIYPFEI